MFLFLRNCCQLGLKFKERSLLPQDERSSIWLTLKLRLIMSTLAKLLGADTQLSKKKKKKTLTWLVLRVIAISWNGMVLKTKKSSKHKTFFFLLFFLFLYYFCGDTMSVVFYYLLKDHYYMLIHSRLIVRTEILLN